MGGTEPNGAPPTPPPRVAATVVLELPAATPAAAPYAEPQPQQQHRSHHRPHLALAALLREYARKWRGRPDFKHPRLPHWTEVVCAFVGSFVGIGALAAIQYNAFDAGPAPAQSLLMVVASFGASAALLYGVPAGPLSQPRNLLWGHVLSALLGVAIRIVIVELGCADHGLDCRWFGAALAVASSVSLMMLTNTMHPPGAATALAAIIGDAVTRQLGFLFVLVPVAAGALVLLLVALLANNAHPHRRYPSTWC